MASFRKERVADVLLSFLGEQLRRLNDPRLESITFTDVEMSPDLKVAKVFRTSHSRQADGSLMETPPELVAQGEKALKGVLSLFRRRIGEELKLRYLPDLLFRYDDSIDRGFRIDQLLQKVGL